jgi:predicted SnoaL-like aldol condensation-catalyzing enzyme
MDLKTFIAAVLTEVCFGSEEQRPVEETIDRYFTPDYRQRTDGETLTRDAFVDHIRHLRTRVVSGQIEVVEALREGNLIADRHRVRAVKPDGSKLEVEVYLFGELAADDRLRRVDEASRVISGGAAEADLARAR